MLFLLNDQIVEISMPEMHLAKRWRALGCGDPYGMRAREALDFVARVLVEHLKEGVRLEETLVEDLGALIIAKTGANAALFPVSGLRVSESRLTILPETILATLKDKMEQGSDSVDIEALWPNAA